MNIQSVIILVLVLVAAAAAIKMWVSSGKHNMCSGCSNKYCNTCPYHHADEKKENRHGTSSPL